MPIEKVAETTGKQSDKKPELEKFRKWFTTFWTETAHSRELSERDRDYYDSIQLTAEELSELEKRGQPPTVKNKIKQKIDYMIGLEQKSRTDPRAYPRTPNHDKDAEAATDGLRYIADNTFFKNKKSRAFKNLCIEGTCALELIFNKKTKEIDCNNIDFRYFWYDHLSRETDFSDAMYRGMYKWVDLETLKGRIGDDHEALTMGVDDMPDKEEDKFFDQERKRLRIFDVYYKKGDAWWYAQFTGSGFIIEPSESVYTEDIAGNKVPTYSIIAQSAFITRKGVRYGYVRELISDQDAINKRSSKALHLLNTNVVIAEAGAVADVQKARREVDKANGYVEVNPSKRFDIERNLDLVQGQFMLLQQDIQDLEAAGANAALSGKDDGVASGRAIQLNQQGGAIEIGGIYDSLKILEIACYRRMWNLVKQFKDEEWWVRVTDDEDNLKFVGFNRKITRLEKLIEENGNERVAAMLEEQGISPDNPMLHEVIIDNRVSEIDVDIIIEDSPDITNIQGEEFEQIALLAQTRPDITTEMLISASSIRNKDKILKKLKGEDEEGIAQMQQMQQQLQEAAMQMEALQAQLQELGKQAQSATEEAQKLMADNQKLKVQAAMKEQELAIKAQELAIKDREAQTKEKELLIKQFEADTDRMKSVNDAGLKQVNDSVSDHERILSEIVNIQTQKPKEDPVIKAVIESNKQTTLLIEELVKQMTKPKEMQIKAPSGQVYKGTLNG